MRQNKQETPQCFSLQFNLFRFITLNGNMRDTCKQVSDKRVPSTIYY